MYKEPMIYDQKIATCQRTCAHVEREREREREILGGLRARGVGGSC